ncbi:hypothetical protein GALL_485910 [mine drainage metagenome]|uniref:Uncharacterized protein n=1 Tax=mine drainage metagenome TaxID=410659 RepID=A0A1J5PPW5_9ZZZZ
MPRLVNVLQLAQPAVIQHAQTELSLGVAMFGCALVPARRLGVVLRCAASQRKQCGAFTLRHGVVHFGRLAQPCNGLHLIEGDSFARREHVADAVAGFAVPLVRGPGKLRGGAHRITRHGPSAGVERAEIALPSRITLLCGTAVPRQRLLVAARQPAPLLTQKTQSVHRAGQACLRRLLP